MLRSGTRVLAIVALVAMVVVPRPARAEVRVERSDGADSCPDSVSFATRMRDGAAAPEPRARSVTVRFERTARGYRSSVLTSDGMQRSLTDEASSCDGLAEATLLAVKLALDLSEADAPALAPAPAIVPAAEPLRAAPVPAAARRSTLGLEILAGGILAFGIGSPVAPGVRGGAALTLGEGRWSIGLTGLVLPAQTHDVGEGTVDVSVAGGGMEGCGRARVAHSLLLALCGRAEVMSIAGSAHGFARAEEHARPLFAGTLLGRARARIAGPIAAFVEAGAVLPIVRERFEIDRVGVVYDPPLVSGTAGIGVLVDFE